MGRKAFEIADQITQLKGRGMVMDLGEEKAKEVLLDIGYYRLGFYWHHFEIDDNHNLKKGTLFSDVLGLYYLDTDLKYILSRALNRIEGNFKTKLIYHISTYYSDNPTWFADKKIMTHQFVNKFPDFYDKKFKENNRPIKKHHEKYVNDIYAPAWKTIEFLTFGSTITMFASISNKSLRETIALQYDIKSLRVFESYMLTLLYLRNICAHGDVLYDSNTPKEIATSPLVKFNHNNRHFLDSSIKVVYYFLSKISKNRLGIIKNEIDLLFNKKKNNQVLKSIIEEKIGYIY